MIKNYKQLLLIFGIFISLNLFAQESDKTVEITTTGIGKTETEARDNAIRSALEQAFGAFISSKTEMLNDNIVSEQMSSVTSGNIQSFDILSKNIKNDGTNEVILKAKISVEKLISFCENKGVEAEFKGALFALNITQQRINRENEYKILQNASIEVIKMLNKCFDYSISIQEPTSISNNLFKIPVTVEGKINNNITNVSNYLESVLNGLNCSNKEIESLKKSNLGINYIAFQSFGSTDDNSNLIALRNEESFDILRNIIVSIKHSFYNFSINNGIENINGDIFEFQQFPENLYINKTNFYLKNTSNINKKCNISTINIVPTFIEPCYSGTDETFTNHLHPNSIIIFDNFAIKPGNFEKDNGISEILLNSKFKFLKNNKYTSLPKETGLGVLSFNFKIAQSRGLLYFENKYSLEQLKSINKYKITPNN